MLKPMRGGVFRDVETERGKPRRGEHQERSGRLFLGNTERNGTDLTIA